MSQGDDVDDIFDGLESSKDLAPYPTSDAPTPSTPRSRANRRCTRNSDGTPAPLGARPSVYEPKSIVTRHPACGTVLSALRSAAG